jgi:IS30 family transposase
MPTGYQHLTRTQRCQIETLKSRGYLQSEIAKTLKVSASTISRELKRNCLDNNIYDFHEAYIQHKIRRWKASSKPRKLTPNLIKKIECYILKEWSPEQISGRLKLEGINISHEIIYQHIWKNKANNGILYKRLRRAGKKYKKRSSAKPGSKCIPNRVDITERPAIVDTKSRIGDWEGDTIIGKEHKGAILSYVDRKSKFTILAKLPRKTAKSVLEATINRLKDLNKNCHTITYDNGKEFCGHEKIAKELGVKCYFATPYHSWERGLNEHTNGLVRQYFPKKTDLTKITNEEVKNVEEKLNNRPRKVLGFLTPKEVLLEAV